MDLTVSVPEFSYLLDIFLSSWSVCCLYSFQVCYNNYVRVGSSSRPQDGWMC